MSLKLNPARIEALAARKDVDSDAVINFLISLDSNPDRHTAYENMRADAKAYKWNPHTYEAICAGISEATES